MKKKPCPRHPDSPRYPSGGCVECTRQRTRARRAALRKARGPKPLSPRQKALRAGKKYYIGRPCVRHGKKALRWVRGGGCLLCHRETYPSRLSPRARENKLARMRAHQRRKTQALRVLTLLGGPPLGF